MTEQYIINLMEIDKPWHHILNEIDMDNVTFKHDIDYKKSKNRMRLKRNELIFENKEDLITFKLKYL